MSEGYRIVRTEKPEWEAIGQAITSHNRDHAGDDNAQTVCFVVQGPDEEVVGGAIGVIYWDWLSVNLMWVKGELRGRGYGRRLLTMAEDEARARGARHAFLDTFSFQAPGFYKKHGYEVFGELPEFPAGHQRYFLKKDLCRSASA